MSERIGIDEARTLLADAVATQGRDFVYNPGGGKTCHNVPYLDAPEGDPRRLTGCLVGTAMKLSGRIPDIETSPYRKGSVSRFASFLTTEAEAYFRAAQIAQDHGRTWGEAFDAAEESIGVRHG